MIEEPICYPYLELIVEECITKIQKQFPKYKNSWLNQSLDISFWHKRLMGEIKEIFEVGQGETRRQEIIDAINILAFMYTLDLRKDENKLNEKLKKIKPISIQDEIFKMVGAKDNEPN